jgi:hypothetical protein
MTPKTGSGVIIRHMELNFFTRLFLSFLLYVRNRVWDARLF